MAVSIDGRRLLSERAKTIAVSLLATTALACTCFCCPTGGDNGVRPEIRYCGDGGAAVAPTTRATDAPVIDGLDSTLRSFRAVARQCGDVITFLDPRGGGARESVRLTAPAGTRLVLEKALLLDTPADTLVVAPYGAEHPENGLNPEFVERRLQVYSRASGRRLLDTAVRMPGERASRAGWDDTRVLGADPKGYLVLNHQPADDPSTDVVYAQPLRTGLAPWSTSEAGGLVPSIKAVAVDGGVVLVSRVDLDSAQLSGYDVATGRRIWRRAYPAQSIVPQHPRCAAGRDGTFVLGGRDWPVIVQARTGQPRGGNYSVCVRPDPVRPVGIFGGAGNALGAVDLATGKALWEVSADRARAVGLTATSVYDNRVYATTDTARLVLDARTGKELSRGWTRAPVERHDGWTVSYDIALGRAAVFAPA